MKLINRFFFKIERIMSMDRINVVKTIYINLRLLSFKVALKLPILVYGHCKILALSGTVKFKGPVSRGMIKIGQSDYRSKHYKSTLLVNGVLEFGSNVILRRGIRLVCQKKAIINISDNVFISDNNIIISFNKIEIGSGTRFGNDTTLMDSDFHYLVDLNENRIHNNVSPIKIGQSCWIGGNVIIKKGGVLPDHIIVAGPFSMVGKDLSHLPPFSLIAGSPAKLKVSGVKNIMDVQTEHRVSEFFQLNEVNKVNVEINGDSLYIL